MINYYEVLEVSENASSEVIEKAYKVLAKKYHPDLNPENKKDFEDKMKLINEAYSVLTNEKKRANYNSVLQKYKAMNAKKEDKKSTESSQDVNIQLDEKTKKKLQKKMQEKYLEAYDSYLRERGYKLAYKWTFKRIMKAVLAIIILILIFFLLFLIPPIHNFLLSLYNGNSMIKLLVDMIVTLVTSIFNTITSLFGGTL